MEEVEIICFYLGNCKKGTIADATGYVEVSWTRLDIRPPWELTQAALTRAGWHADQGDWGAWSRALSEADYWETKEFEHIPPSM